MVIMMFIIMVIIMVVILVVIMVSNGYYPMIVIYQMISNH
jgi:hypothetical protein